MDSTIDNNGKIIDTGWQIKKQSEYAREILYNLFQLNNKQVDKEFEEDKINKIIVVFDDNLAGGSSMDNTCYELERIGWQHIIPISLGVIPVSPGVNRQSASKQRDRDAFSDISLRQRINKNRIEKGFSVNPEDDEEEIHNTNYVFDAEGNKMPYSDYENKSNFSKDKLGDCRLRGYSYQSPSKINKPRGRKLSVNIPYQSPSKINKPRGRKLSVNIPYQGAQINAEDVINSTNPNETILQYIHQRMPNMKVRPQTLKKIRQRCIDKMKRINEKR